MRVERRGDEYCVVISQAALEALRLSEGAAVEMLPAAEPEKPNDPVYLCGGGASGLSRNVATTPSSILGTCQVNWHFLSVDVVIALHKALIEESGGSHGLRDYGLLESAISRAENKVNYDLEANVASVGASFAWGLIKNHTFIDGNKRIGLGTLAVFLKANGLC